MDRISYMLAVPADEEELKDPEKLMERLKEAGFFTVLDVKMEEE